MVFLIDTCTLIWLGGPQAKVPLSVRTQLARSEVRVSEISRIEIAIKESKYGSFGVDFDALIAAAGFQSVPFPIGTHRLYATLPDHHKDPFDRMLIAHALCEGLTLVTCDSDIRKYDVPTFW
jgi:PIN domain nuclease of toxin-antitoxin system